MKTTLAAITLASLSAGALFAQNGIDNLEIKGDVGYEGEYISRGKEHSDGNMQVNVKTGYSIPGMGETSPLLYANLFAMLPVAQHYNQVDWTLGAKASYEAFTFDIGYTLHTYPNNDSFAPAETNRGDYNRSNEVFIGASTSQYEWFTPKAYIYYDFNLQQVTYEAMLTRRVEGQDLGLSPDLAFDLAAYIGYLSARRYDGDQGAAKVRNGYAYAGLSADVVYRIAPNANVSLGMRYAWNNDGEHGNNTEKNLWWGTKVTFAY